ncbi:MAG: hypothetical protein ACRDJW_02495 [Thermomicrobiales bacterium]
MSAVSETVAKEQTTKSPTAASELLYADAGDVEATTVTMERSGAETVTGQRVVMDHSDARHVDARSAQLDRSGVLSLKSERAVLHGGAAGVVAAGEARIVRSKVGLIASGQTTVEGDLKALVHIGPVDGNVRTVLDPVSAVGAGAAFGVVVVIARWLARRLLRND